MKKIAKLTLALSFPILLIGISCSKEMNSENYSNSDALHFSFKTPDWERWVKCELDFEPITLNDSTNILSFSSSKQFFILSLIPVIN